MVHPVCLSAEEGVNKPTDHEGRLFEQMHLILQQQHRQQQQQGGVMTV